MHHNDDPADLLRTLVGRMFDTELCDQDREFLASNYHQLSQLNNKYGEKFYLNQGALKTVYKRRDYTAKRDIAWATLNPGLSEIYTEVFIYEAWLTASLNHPNIIKVHEVGIEEGIPFFTMDLLSGRSLESFLDELNLRSKLEVFTTICGAISHAHSVGILHLDIKPSNINFDGIGEVLVCDWGLGKLLENENETCLEALELLDTSHQTLYGEIKGTPGYMAPEQAMNGAQKDQRTDIYSLGALLYFILTGRCPHNGKSNLELIEQTLAGEIPPAHQINSNIPRPISLIIQKSLSLLPEDRYCSVLEMQNEIFLYLDSRVTLAEKYSIWRKALLFNKRHWKVISAVIAGLSLSSAILLVAQRRIESHTKTIEQNSHENQKLTKDYINLNREYQAFEEAITDSRIELSYKLCSAALERFNIFLGKGDTNLNSVTLIEEMNILTSKAHKLSPTGHTQILLLQANISRLNIQRIFQED